MKLSVFKFLFHPGLVLVFLAAFMGGSEDDMDSLADKCQSGPSFSIGKNEDEIFWKIGGDIYQNNTKTQFTNNLITDSQGSFFNWKSKSPNSNLLLSLRIDIELFEECKGTVHDYLTVIDVDNGEVNYIKFCEFVI